ncbi:MAG: MFS transporter, partial [Promethearchaeota archaeon]
VESIIAVKKPIVNDVKSKTIKTLKKGFFLSFLILIIAIMISSMNGSIAYPFYQVYLINNLKVTDPTMVMLIYFPSQVVALLFAPKLGKISDKINPIIGISIVGSLGAFVTWLIINTNSGIVFGIILIADSTFAWTGNLILQNVLSRISKVHRGKIFGAAQWLSMLGSIAGPLIGGLVWDNVGPTAPFIISIFIELSIIPLYIIAIKLLKPYMAEKID